MLQVIVSDVHDLYVYDNCDVYTHNFVSYVRQHFTSILPSNNVFDKEF